MRVILSALTALATQAAAQPDLSQPLLTSDATFACPYVEHILLSFSVERLIRQRGDSDYRPVARLMADGDCEQLAEGIPVRLIRSEAADNGAVVVQVAVRNNGAAERLVWVLDTSLRNGTRF